MAFFSFLAESGSVIAHTFRALRGKNYRLFFIGQGISLIGTWMQQAALGWLIYRLTNSPFWLGALGFANQFPIFVVAPFGGVLADRWDRRRALIAIQTLEMVQAGVLAAFVLSGRITPEWILILTLVSGVLSAFEIPTRQAYVVEMVEHPSDLSNAIALNSTLFNSARLIGPVVAGVIIAVMGEGVCFLVNALSFLAVVGSLWAMRTPRKKSAPSEAPIWTDLRAGVVYAYHFLPIRATLVLLAVMSLIGTQPSVLMPLFAKDILHGDAHTQGLLLGASGLGATIGVLYLASRRSVLGLGRVIVTGGALFGVGLMGFALSSVLTLSLAAMLLSGFGLITLYAASNTVLQTIVDEDKRGRVMSLYSMAFVGAAPLGSLLVGWLASRAGAPVTLFASGLFCVAGSLYSLRLLPLLWKDVKPVYIRKGILPEIAQAVSAATEPSAPVKNKV